MRDLEDTMFCKVFINDTILREIHVTTMDANPKYMHISYEDITDMKVSQKKTKVANQKETKVAVPKNTEIAGQEETKIMHKVYIRSNS